MSRTFEGYIQHLSDQTGIPYDDVVDIYERLTETRDVILLEELVSYGKRV